VAAYPTNQFELTGYRYMRRHTNVLTGEVTQTQSLRFDVISWQVMLPYRRLNSSNEVIISYEALGWSNDEGTTTPNLFVSLDGASC